VFKHHKDELDRIINCPACKAGIPFKLVRYETTLPLCWFCTHLLRLPKTFPFRIYCAAPGLPFRRDKPTHHCKRFDLAPQDARVNRRR
jgi:hypothetical protein